MYYGKEICPGFDLSTFDPSTGGLAVKELASVETKNLYKGMAVAPGCCVYALSQGGEIVKITKDGAITVLLQNITVNTP